MTLDAQAYDDNHNLLIIGGRDFGELERYAKPIKTPLLVYSKGTLDGQTTEPYFDVTHQIPGLSDINVSGFGACLMDPEQDGLPRIALGTNFHGEPQDVDFSSETYQGFTFTIDSAMAELTVQTTYADGRLESLPYPHYAPANQACGRTPIDVISWDAHEPVKLQILTADGTVVFVTEDLAPHTQHRFTPSVPSLAQ